MSLASGTRIGPYEILATLGAGGMGEVYRAKDTRLNRVVAVKAMHGTFAQDPERIARFEREAQLLASLNHPNIAAIHGVEEAGGSRYLVLEFVDGRPLSEILRTGALPLNEALAIAGQIATALAAAHERGIIHRDLKPGNVMVTADGQVKLLDFGLGKAIESDASQAESGSATPQSPTITMAATQAGIILGTAGYMSPEQARGRIADKRSDVWAFGCVLYELLTGKRAFDGEDVTDVLAAIVRGEPEWNAVATTVPPHVRELIKRCLVKNRTERLADMSVVQYVLSDRSSGAPSVSEPGPIERSGVRSFSMPIVAALIVGAVAITAGVMALMPHGPAGVATATADAAHLAIALPDDDELSWTGQAPVAISPDGSTVAYTAFHENKPWLFVRKLNEREPKLLAGTDNAKSPFFSPDNQWIGFFSQGKLRKITVGGTAIRDLADAPDGRGGAWAPDDTIYYAPTNVSGLFKVSAAGGAASPVTQLDRSKGDISHRWPLVVSEGGTTRLLASMWSGPGPDEVQIVEVDPATGQRYPLIKGGDTARYLAPGYLAYGRLDGLYAVKWRPGDRDLTRTVPITLAESPRLENEGSSAFAVSSNGTLVYVAGGQARLANRLVWVDRNGKIDALPLPEKQYENVTISPDGKRAAIQIQESIITIWIYDFERKTLAQLGSGSESSQSPLWSHDGTFIIYRGTRTGYRNLYRRRADGSGAEERLTTKESVIHSPTSVTPDGEWALFNEGGQGKRSGYMWRVRLNGDHVVEPIMQGTEINGQLSPDGKWIAYQTTADSRSEIFLQSYPGPGTRQQVSVGGGSSPLWSRDGRELFYESFDKLIAVDVATSPALRIGTPHTIVTGRFRPNINSNTQYSVSASGNFLRIQGVQREHPVTSLEVVLNWFRKLEAR